VPLLNPPREGGLLRTFDLRIFTNKKKPSLPGRVGRGL